jgi:hypothetical protein
VRLVQTPTARAGLRLRLFGFLNVDGVQEKKKLTSLNGCE